MATNRLKRKRRSTKTIADFLENATGMARILDGCPWTGEEISAFWQEHKREILQVFMERARAEGTPGRRPEDFINELEEQHPRLRTGQGAFWGPWQGGPPREPTKYPIFETDLQYLGRLGLLEPWEKQGI